MARCLPSLPLISGALAKGEISYSKVRALTRIADAGNEAELLAFARHGTTAHVERLVREWRRLDQDDACQAARAERPGAVAVAHRRRQLRGTGPAQPRGGEPATQGARSGPSQAIPRRA